MLKAEAPLVSVIIPCYNAERFAEKAVSSVMQQSYTSLEIIIVNDCSTDKSLSILEQLQKKDSRIIIISNNKNLGIAETLNVGIRISTGKYIARMDADDICFEDRIEKQVAFLEQNPDTVMCGGNLIKIDEDDKVTGRIRFPRNNDVLKAELLFYCPFAHPAMMIKKDALQTTTLYKNLAPAEDYELWLSIAEKFKIDNLPDNLIYYRTHSNNITSNRADKLFNVLNTAVHEHLKTSGFAGNYLGYHLKFLEGTWYTKSSVQELANIKYWKKELMQIHNGNTVLSKVFDKYISLAMLSILKSKTNPLQVKLKAAANLLTINPFITLQHFFR